MGIHTKIALGFFSALIAVWDLATTFNGLMDYTNYDLMLSVVFTVIINGIIFLSCLKIKFPLLIALGCLCLLIAIICDIITAYNGNIVLLSAKSVISSTTNNSVSSTNNFTVREFLAGCMTILTVSGSITISYITFRLNEKFK